MKCRKCGNELNDDKNRENPNAGLYVIIAVLVMIIFIMTILLFMNRVESMKRDKAEEKIEQAETEKQTVSLPAATYDDTALEDTKENEKEKEDDRAADASDGDWQQLYLDYIAGLNKPGNDSGYIGGGLLYVNDDDIPELCLEGNCEATGCVLLTYGNGELDELQTSRLNYTYIEKGNLIDNCGGHMGYYYDYIYSIKNGKWESVAVGEYEDDYEKSDPDNDKWVYKYTWNGKDVTEDEYSSKLKSVYDAGKAKTAKIYPLAELETLIKTGKAPFVEHRYELIVQDVTWKEAEQLCRQKGGYLATLTSKEEFEKVSKQMEKEDKTNINFFVGATRDTSYDKNNGELGVLGYFWVQEQVEIIYFAYRDDFNFWLPDEPSYTGQDAQGNEVDEKYVDLIYRKADGRCYLNDVADDILKEAPSFAGKIGYICEYE